MNGAGILILAVIVAFSIACCRRSVTPESSKADPAAVARGRELFAEHCAICHGSHADGHGLRSELDPRPPDFTNPQWQATHRTEDVINSIRNGRRGTAMPSWRTLNEQDIRDLTAFVKSR